MEPTIILHGLTIDQLLSKIDSLIEKRVSEKLDQLTPPKSNRFLTRKETALILQISLPTLNIWTKQEIIPSYRIQSKIYYKSDEIESLPAKRKFSGTSRLK